MLKSYSQILCHTEGLLKILELDFGYFVLILVVNWKKQNKTKQTNNKQDLYPFKVELKVPVYLDRTANYLIIQI